MTTEISRRSILRGIGASALAVPAGVLLAGCGSDGDKASGNTSSGGAGTTAGGSGTTAGGTESSAGGGPSSGGAESGGLLAKAKKQGYITLVIANEPPYTKLTEDGKYTGCAPDVCRAVCKEMGFDVKGVVAKYDSMIPGLKAGRWDTITAGLFMKQSRCAQVQYTSPVIVSTESFGVPKGNPKNITTIADVKDNPDLKIVVLPGAFEQGILENADIPDSQMVKINDNRSGIEAVTAGRADAFLLPTLSLKGLNNNDKFTVTPPIKDAPKTGSGAAFRKSDQAFVDEYNKTLEKLKQTKEFDKILDKWGFDPAPAKDTTVEELCKNPG